MLVQVKHQKVTEHTLLKKLTEYVERVDTDMVSIARTPVPKFPDPKIKISSHFWNTYEFWKGTSSVI